MQLCSTGAPNEVYAACLDGEVDFGIVALPTRRPQLEIVPLGHDELVVAAPPGHPDRAPGALSARRASTDSRSSASTATSRPAGWSTGSCAATACASAT